MSTPLGFLKDFFTRGQKDNLLQIFTPEVASARGTGTKLALAGATMLGLAVSGLVAAAALTWLLLALGAIYFLLTQVLGIRLDVDPAAFVQRAQQYAQHQRN